MRRRVKDLSAHENGPLQGGEGRERSAVGGRANARTASQFFPPGGCRGDVRLPFLPTPQFTVHKATFQEESLIPSVAVMPSWRGAGNRTLENDKALSGQERALS